MKICWLRHGEKENAYGPDRANPDLTAEGKKQAKRLAERVAGQKLPQPAALFASQTKRSHQTLEDLGLFSKLSIQTQELLNQRSQRESSEDFHQRVLRAMRWIEDLAGQKEVSLEAFYFCSHIDWLDEAYSSLPTQESLPYLGFWRPGEYVVFEIENGLWKLVDQGVL